ncbi:hypothetical protein P168DRAFT_252492, partial [Aspergillus campestris IBT 28561]
MSAEELENEAEYGRLPFDIFLSVSISLSPRLYSDLTGKQQERWHHNATGDTREHWERLPYQHRAESTPPELNEEITRVLATHQTSHERNISLVSCEGLQTVWLRTCYDPDLTGKYEEMKQESEIPGWGVSGDKILDDPSRYDFDDGSGGPDSWRRVMVRVPGLTDFRGVFDMNGDGTNLQYISGQNDEDTVARAHESEKWRDLSLAQLRIQVGLYLLDREAIASGFIKVLWLDEHGQIAWENRLDPFTSELDRLTGSLLNATSLVELAGYDGTRGALIE